MPPHFINFTFNASAARPWTNLSASFGVKQLVIGDKCWIGVVRWIDDALNLAGVKVISSDFRDNSSSGTATVPFSRLRPLAPAEAPTAGS
jgi:hypothetical protein